MKIAITGHSTERLRGHEEHVREWINQMLDWWEADYRFGDGEPIDFAITGMAPGVDLIFAQEALKRRTPLLCFYAYEPVKYSEEEQKIIDNPLTTVMTASGSYSKSSFIIRDRRMVDDCDILLAVWDGIEQGGTWETVKYAEDNNKPIVFCPWDERWNEE